MKEDELKVQINNGLVVISWKYGNRLVATLRKIYGSAFAQEFAAHETLDDVLLETGSRSLSQLHLNQLHADHAAGVLDERMEQHGASASPMTERHDRS